MYRPPIRPYELYHHGVKGMHWGIRNGPPYPLDSGSLAKQVNDFAIVKEKQITRDVTDAVKRAGGRMYGLNNRLKTKDSIQRKISTDSEEKGITEYKAAKDVKDAVRYTMLKDNKDFVSGYFKMKNELLKKHYEEVRCRNYFEMYREGKVKHKSVQSVFKDPSGYLFEVQFQTPESQKAKDEKTPIYEERRKPGLSDERKKLLEDKMTSLMEPVPYPPDISKIKSH